MVFTVEMKGAPGETTDIELYLDGEALDCFIHRLNDLRRSGGHEHFMTSSWAGQELTDKLQNPSNMLINHLRVTVVR